MNRLTRYFLGAYIAPLVASAGALVVLVMMGDLMERLDKFITGKTGLGRTVEYILDLIPLRLPMILPVAALLAALFSLGALSHRKEIVAAMSGGVDPWKCVRPILTLGALMSLLVLGLGEYVNPRAFRRSQKIWNADVRRVASDTAGVAQDVTRAGRDGIFYSVGKINVEDGVMEDVLVDRTENGRPVSQIRAARAEWEGNRWVLRNGVERFFDPDGVALARQKNFILKELRTREAPADLIPPQEETDALGYLPLKNRVKQMKALGLPTRRLEVEMHMKLALPWANFIVLLLGIPFAFQKSGGKVKAVGFALGVAFFYFGLMQVGRALGQKSWCDPWIGAWMTNLFFLTVGVWMFARMRRAS